MRNDNLLSFSPELLHDDVLYGEPCSQQRRLWGRIIAFADGLERAHVHAGSGTPSTSLKQTLSRLLSARPSKVRAYPQDLQTTRTRTPCGLCFDCGLKLQTFDTARLASSSLSCRPGDKCSIRSHSMSDIPVSPALRKQLWSAGDAAARGPIRYGK